MNHIVTQSTSNYQGIFGYIENATITGIILEDASSIVGNAYVGGIVGYATNSTIQNCANYGNIYGSGERFAGVVGDAMYTTIIGCVNHGKVQDNNERGGLTARVGGIAGHLKKCSEIKYCYNLGYVESHKSGAKCVGGICGRTLAIDDNNIEKMEYASKIQYCSNSGNVSSTDNRVGGICGENNVYNYVTNCDVTSNIVVTGRKMTAVTNIGTKDGDYMGKVVGYAYSESLPYCGNFGNITTGETVYYVVNGFDNRDSQYWSSTNLNIPKLVWE